MLRVSVFQALVIMISFSSLIVAVIALSQKK
ncbi:putative holin-like toxin [Cytobacillus solani]